MTSALHDARLAAVVAAVTETGARTVLDLGCGSGDLILRLAPLAAITQITGLDLDLSALRILQGRLDDLPLAARAKVQIAHASMTARHAALRGYECACLVETIEHLPLADLNRLERALFGDMRPRHVIVTTPNAEYNPVLGVPAHRFRHPGHQFEWTRDRFGQWADGVATRNGYAVTRRDIGATHPTLGGASQMALFTRSG
ncbi:3' terminal RNA ribose 2'-O-methyltransferase Hen1 [Roseovarius tolerans]|uniref:Small RNA 2'-O-methyltransferase n=1 Tax=Roseovarius tolerans TaxID=74031 RepID=A0A1H8GIF3_9RHOB|nr:methyltransferase domain-containing protein [Roseovarius tolerans]SEN43743.1 3' terminal RNA ribose 2'-O-methyltransferase Hen1 [Roseovarius tolerans]